MSNGDRADGASSTEPEDWGTWEDKARRKYLKGLDLTVAERLAWLDEMIALAEAHGALPKPRDAWGQPIAEGAQVRSLPLEREAFTSDDVEADLRLAKQLRFRK